MTGVGRGQPSPFFHEYAPCEHKHGKLEIFSPLEDDEVVCRCVRWSIPGFPIVQTESCISCEHDSWLSRIFDFSFLKISPDAKVALVPFVRGYLQRFNNDYHGQTNLHDGMCVRCWWYNTFVPDLS